MIDRRSAQQVPRWTTTPTWSRSRRSSQNAGYDYETEFLFGLDLILDGLERFRAAGSV